MTTLREHLLALTLDSSAEEVEEANALSVCWLYECEFIEKTANGFYYKDHNRCKDWAKDNHHFLLDAGLHLDIARRLDDAPTGYSCGRQYGRIGADDFHWMQIGEDAQVESIHSLNAAAILALLRTGLIAKIMML